MRNACLFLLATGLLGCSTAPTEPPTAKAPASAAAPAGKPQPAATGPERAVRGYLHWYAAHQQELNVSFIDNADAADSTKFYAVDIPASEAWLADLKASGRFSSAFLDDWRRYIRRYADTLRLHPQNDGPPMGFDHDLLMHTQEPDEQLSELQKGTYTTQVAGPTQATVRARGPQHEGWRQGLDFKLTKNAAGKWLIDDISVPDDLVQ